MKLFENIAEYQAFKRKYELMGELEEERLIAASKDPNALQDFLQFMDGVHSLVNTPQLHEMVQEEELQADIDRQIFFVKIPPTFYDPS